MVHVSKHLVRINYIRVYTYLCENMSLQKTYNFKISGKENFSQFFHLCCSLLHTSCVVARGGMW